MNRRRAIGQPWLRVVPVAGAPDVVPERALHDDDDALIEAVARGDSKVAGRLYDRLIGVVDRALYRVFGRRESDHDDLVQATFEQIVLTLVRQRFAGACSLSSWACSVASHVGLNALRARRRERGVMALSEDTSTLPAIPAQGADVEHEAGVREQIERVRSHLATLAPEKAETILLHDVFGHDLSEIAVLTGVSVAAAQSRLVRGRKELFAKLDARGERDALQHFGREPGTIDGGRRGRS
jgi:RNA polymerase sigma-70 factor (ECF subfamily)